MKRLACSLLSSAILTLALSDDEIPIENIEVLKKYQLPDIPHQERIFFFESFQQPTKSQAKNTETTANDENTVLDVESFGWILSEAEEYRDQVVEISDEKSIYHGDNTLLLKKAHQRYAISKALEQPFSLDTEQVTIQFEAKFNNLLSCSGAYLKFVAEADENDEAYQKDQKQFKERTRYALMFGPDKCGGTNKVHVIFQHQNPITKKYEEKHMLFPVEVPKDKTTHVYTLQLKKSDQSVRVLIDREEKALTKATNKDGFKPPFIPSEIIDDPTDKKPADWEDEAKIPDPDAKKPDDWVEEEFVVDESVTKPEDWSDDEDGEWEAPKKRNPLYKGEFKAPLIDNPNYKGKWAPQQIPNPGYFTQEFPMSNLPKISHVMIEVLANDAEIGFDNIVITHDYEVGSFIADNLALNEKRPKEVDEELEEKLKKKRDERSKILETEFGFYSLLEYGFGEIYEVYERFPRIFIAGLLALGGLLFWYVCIKIGGFYTLSEREIQLADEEDKKEKEALHKKNDDAAAEAEDLSDAEIEEIDSDDSGGDKTPVVRRRSRKSKQ